MQCKSRWLWQNLSLNVAENGRAISGIFGVQRFRGKMQISDGSHRNASVRKYLLIANMIVDIQQVVMSENDAKNRKKMAPAVLLRG